MTNPMTVYLIGAGPGDPGLLSVRAFELIKRADVVIYDYLAGEELVTYAPEHARLEFVGKKGFSQHVTQDEINELIVTCVRELQAQGLDHEGVVVRLKGGDPFVFGRGGEEALALREAGIAFEVVPGVTAGIAAPAYAGIPVTHRQVASSVTFVTGHEDPTRSESSIDWPALAALCKRGNTVCFYMGVRNVANIARNLMEQGTAPETPVALVRWGTTPSQETLCATLANVAEQVEKAQFKAPAIIVVGQVVALRERLSWFEDKPLFGKHFVVTRSRTQASGLVSRLRTLGAKVTEFPTIHIVEPDSYDLLDDSLHNLAHFSCVIFTSVNGVDAFFQRLGTLPVEGERKIRDARALRGLRVAAIGPATAQQLRTYGIEADIVPSEYRAEAAFEALMADYRGLSDDSSCQQSSLKGERILLPRAQVAREILPQMLRDAGAEVVVAPAYKTVPPEGASATQLVELLESDEVDGITFTSSSTARNLMDILGERALELLAHTNLYSIGPITSNTLAEAGATVAATASEYTIDGLIELLVTTYDKGDGSVCHTATDADALTASGE